MNMLEKMADLCNHVLVVLREIVYYCLETKPSKYTYTVSFLSKKVASLILSLRSLYRTLHVGSLQGTESKRLSTTNNF